MYSIYVRHEINSPYVRYGQKYRDKRKAIDNAKDIGKPAEVRSESNILLFHNGKEDTDYNRIIKEALKRVPLR